VGLWGGLGEKCRKNRVGKAWRGTPSPLSLLPALIYYFLISSSKECGKKWGKVVGSGSEWYRVGN